MFISRLSALAVTLAVAGTVPLAAGTDPIELMESSYIKVVAALGGGKADFKDHLVILASPGTPIDTHFSMDKVADRRVLQLLFDRVPNARPVYQVKGNATYSEVLGNVLHHHQLPMPQTLDVGTQKAYDDARKVVDPKGKIYPAYQDALNAFADAQDEYDYALKESHKPVNPKPIPTRVKQELERATKTLKTLETEQKTARGIIFQVSARGGFAWWTTLADEYDEVKKNAQLDTKAFPVEFYPPPETWNPVAEKDKPKLKAKYGAKVSDGSKGWTHILIKCSEMKKDEEYHKMAADAHLGWASSWSLNINASWSKESLDILKEDKDATIEFDVKRVAVMRPWFPSVADDRSWYWEKGLPKAPLSYGSVLLNAGHGDDKDDMARPQLPTYVNEVYIGRDFSLKAKASASAYKLFEEKLHADLGLSVMGFSLGGSFDKHDKTEHEEKWDGGFTLYHKGAEIMAYGASILPASPVGTPDMLKGMPRRPGK